jgi:plastocyanin
LPTNDVINELVLYTATATATDSDIPTNALTFALVSAPTGMVIGATSGVITWTPSEAQGPSTNVILVSVTDTNAVASSAKALSVTNSFTLVVNELNLAPQLPGQTNRSVNELATLTVTNKASDADLPVNALSYTLLDPPSGASIDTNGVITWTPGEAYGATTNVITTVVTDTNPWAVNAQSLSATNAFTVVVNEVNVAPVLTLPDNETIAELTLYTNNATATDADLPANALTFALVSGPEGLTVSPAGAITWTPTERQGPSTNVIFISVTDINPLAVNATSLSVTGSFTLIVREVNTAPVLVLPPDQTIHALTTLSTNATATDGDLPAQTLVFSLVAGPAGLSVSPGGLVTWTPEDSQVGTASVTVRVADGGTPELSATNSFSVTVVGRPLLSITSVTSSNLTLSWTAIAGQSYRVQGCGDLSAAAWENLAGDVTASASTASKTDVLTTTNRLYRVRVLP